MVVVKMYGDRENRCIYYVRCVKCGQGESGYYDEIPLARFDTEAAREIRNG
jgi:hypothetical protein